MRTARFEPIPDWVHALQSPICSQHCLFVAEERGRVVGWCRLFPTDAGPEGVQCVDVGIGLLSAYRDRRFGRAMLQQGLRWAAQHHVELATLSIRADNARAIHVFELCGFRHTTCPPHEWLEMACRLQPSGGYGDARSSVDVHF